MKQFRIALAWICIGACSFGLALTPEKSARADIFGGDLALLTELIAKAVEQIQQLQSILNATGQATSILEDMNRGVREVLRLADTAHIPLPPEVYQQANTLDSATRLSHEVFGELPGTAPKYGVMQYQSGTEALYLSEDALDYSSFLDKQGESVKQSAVVANQSAATRLTAETLGVLLHAVSHSNRLEAKSLEISATQRLQDSQRENARYESFVNTHQSIEDDLRGCNAPDLNAFDAGATR